MHPTHRPDIITISWLVWVFEWQSSQHSISIQQYRPRRPCLPCLVICMSVHFRNLLSCLDNHQGIICISISPLLALKLVPRIWRLSARKDIDLWTVPSLRGCLESDIVMCMHASAKADRGQCESFERIPGMSLYVL